jgi:CRISPR-associated endonuclease Cas1
MTASQNLPQSSAIRKSGVLVLNGYGIRVQVHAGHLLLHDGIADERRTIRLPRVNHGLKRLVMIGSDGFITLEALRWLADQDAAFVMLERDGSVLATTGPVRPSDARLRRAQALAIHSGDAQRIARELISQKLLGQEKVVREKLLDSESADEISNLRSQLANAETIPAVRLVEAQAGAVYWSAWRDLPISFPKNDMPRVPGHWRTFGTRQSPLSGSPRLAANPSGAMLNFLYGLLESEARLAAAALGLDPGLGMLHVDTPNRDSLACDLMEPVRPQVDAFLLDWITRQPLKREWFFERRDGNCRLIGSFATRLSETAPTWGRAVAPLAEWVARALWSSTSKAARKSVPATRLTQRHRSEARGEAYAPVTKPAPAPEKICRTCGVALKEGKIHCASCAGAEASKRMIEIARLGRVATHTPEAEALRSASRLRHAAALKAWQPSEHPNWLTESGYQEKIQPALRDFPVSAIASTLGISLPYATDIRAGRRRPHPRHWHALAQLVSLWPQEA